MVALLRNQDASLNRQSLLLLMAGARWSFATFGHVAVACVLAYILQDETGPLRAWGWAAALSSVVIYQAIFSTRHRDDELSDAQVTKLLRHFVGTAVLVGASWACAGFLLFPENNRELQLFLTFIMGGMTLSAIGTQHVYLPACFASMSYAVPVLGVRFALAGEYVEFGLLLLYNVVLLQLGRKLNEFSVRTHLLQEERELLLQEVTQKADDLERAQRTTEEARLSAEEANTAKSRFLAQASHDLRQPIHAIGLFLETIRDTDVAPDVAQIVGRVKQSLSVLAKLFDSLLDVTLLDTGQMVVKQRTFALGDVFAEIAQDFAPVAEVCHVQLKAIPTNLNVHSDPVLLRRLLQNLVANAIRFADGERVTFGCRRVGNTGIAIEVHDTGRGIAPDDQARIFGEFVRLDNPPGRSAEPGMGLGLSIVRRIAELMGLSISLRSNPGVGSTFRITGLTIDATAPPVVEYAVPDTADKLRGLTVYILDDDPDTLEATGAILARWGCNVELLERWELSGLPGAPVNSPNQPDVILCDYELPQGSGLGIVEEMRMHFSAEIPAIIISGNSTATLRESAKAAALPLLHKPVRPAQLRSAILHAISRTPDHANAVRQVAAT